MAWAGCRKMTTVSIRRWGYDKGRQWLPGLGTRGLCTPDTMAFGWRPPPALVKSAGVGLGCCGNKDPNFYLLPLSTSHCCFLMADPSQKPEGREVCGWSHEASFLRLRQANRELGRKNGRSLSYLFRQNETTELQNAALCVTLGMCVYLARFIICKMLDNSFSITYSYCRHMWCCLAPRIS